MKDNKKLTRKIKIALAVGIVFILAGVSVFAIEAEDLNEKDHMNNVPTTIVDTKTETTDKQPANQNNDIGMDAAKQKALEQVPGAAETHIVKTDHEYDDGINEYEVEIHYNGCEYDFEIDAATGNILCRDIENIDEHNDCDDDYHDRYDD